MPRYRVTIHESADYTIEVDATSEEAAGAAAERLFLEDDINTWPCVVHEREAANIEQVGEN